MNLYFCKVVLLHKINLLLFISICIAFNACSSFGNVKTLDNMYYKDKDLKSSYKYAQKYAKDDFLWAFQSGVLAFENGEFSKSVEYFNLSEDFFEVNNQENAFQGGFKTLASILVGNSMFEYYGNLYESVFINYYKALNAIMLGDYKTSRVEFNRANDRQRRSKDFFKDKINKINEAVEKDATSYSQEMKDMNSQKTYSSLDSIYNAKYRNLEKFKAYEGYVNPIISYVSGIFFLTQNDFNKANDLLKESYAISSKSEVLEDLSILEKRKLNNDENSYTWIFIEEGKSPKKYEIRLDLPLFLVNSKVFYFNIALPNLDSGESYNNDYYINSNDKSKTFKGFEIGHMEAIVANEFNIELPYTIITSLISSSYKAYLQYLLGESFGAIGKIGGAIFSVMSTNADIRSSRILPLRFLVLRVKNTDSIFDIFADGKLLYSFSINKQCNKLCLDKDNIIYLRVLQNGIISNLNHSIRRN